MDEFDRICQEHKTVFSGPLFMIKRKEFPPWQPSGNEGRYSGVGTRAYYFGDTPMTCWNEIKKHGPGAKFEEYAVWEVVIQGGTFIDVGAVEGTQYLLPKEAGGYVPTQTLSSRFTDRKIDGFQYASQPAYVQGGSGTCFCIYQSSRMLEQKDFRLVQWHFEV